MDGDERASVVQAAAPPPTAHILPADEAENRAAIQKPMAVNAAPAKIAIRTLS